MKKITYNVYLFDELGKEAQEKAIEDARDNGINTDYDWHDWILEEAKEKLERQGFENAEINFSGFYSQGDGASFNCDVNLNKFLSGRRCKTEYKKQSKAESLEELSIFIKNNDNHCHEYTMNIEFDDYANDVMTDKLEAFILEEARDQARKIYRELEKENNYLMTDESITETLIANEYYFTEEGKID